ncbi:hypothetical protein ONA70_15245 [Micromonospora yasonensis]|uniref:hypothetical protein n=1 Tax=Micromonospora yasonensis TaxID=1128667 RepID=UPI002230BD43|nr:hypothetical protein [Micromonospora yasonensis]MCW3841455.1 hypothetical protein [Micromonospora yasonensis]
MSTDAPELRMRRRTLRVLGTLRPIKAGYQARPVTVAGLVGLVVAGVVVLLVTAPLAQQVSWLPFVAVPAVVVGGPVIHLMVTAGAAAWYGYGAGYPMLSIADGEIRGRLRGVWADELAGADPEDPDWWDVRLPARALTGVRVERDRPGSPILVLDVPPSVAEALTAHDDTRKLAEHWRSRVNSPAAWQVGLYEGRFRRERRLRMLLEALAAAGAPRP